MLNKAAKAVEKKATELGETISNIEDEARQPWQGFMYEYARMIAGLVRAGYANAEVWQMTPRQLFGNYQLLARTQTEQVLLHAQAYQWGHAMANADQKSIKKVRKAMNDLTKQAQ